MSQLQKSPLALLGALDLKVNGDNPRIFSDTLIPSVEVYDQYLSNQLREQRQVGTLAIGVRTISAAHTPPPGFAWRVLAIGVTVTLNVADIAITGTTVTSITGPAVAGVIVPPVGTLVINGATGLQRALGVLLERPFFCPPGVQIIQRVYMSANVTVAVDVSFTLLTQELPL